MSIRPFSQDLDDGAKEYLRKAVSVTDYFDPDFAIEEAFRAGAEFGRQWQEDRQKPLVLSDDRPIRTVRTSVKVKR